MRHSPCRGRYDEEDPKGAIMSLPPENHPSDINSPREDSPSWIPSSAQRPPQIDANVSPPRVLRKRKYATPDIPDEPMQTAQNAKLDSPRKNTRTYNGYKIAVSPSQKKPRPAPRPLKLPPLRKRDKPLQFQDATNVPNLNAAPKVRAPVRFAPNGLALPQKAVFDPWNVNSDGHQKADGKSMAADRSWRVERQARLKSQFGRTERGTTEVEKGQMSIIDCWTKKPTPTHSDDNAIIPTLGRQESHKENQINTKSTKKSDILRDVVIYVNGSTLPFISDHYLKYLIAQHGGMTTISLARRSVTHVILTPKLSTSQEDGKPISAGGGLAASKIEKQITTMRGPSCKIKFVSPEWVIESIKAGRRLPESKFADWKMVSEKQESVVDQFFILGKPDASKAVKKNSKSEELASDLEYT